MAEVTIRVSVHGSGDALDALADVAALTDPSELRRRLEVRKSPGACWRCVANNDAAAVPLHTRPPCQCKVVVVTDDDGDVVI